MGNPLPGERLGGTVAGSLGGKFGTFWTSKYAENGSE